MQAEKGTVLQEGMVLRCWNGDGAENLWSGDHYNANPGPGLSVEAPKLGRPSQRLRRWVTSPIVAHNTSMGVSLSVVKSGDGNPG